VLYILKRGNSKLLSSSSSLSRGEKHPFLGLDRPSGLDEVEVARISRQSAHEVGKVSDLCNSGTHFC
jgi:hypothetical protein